MAAENGVPRSPAKSISRPRSPQQKSPGKRSPLVKSSPPKSPLSTSPEGNNKNAYVGYESHLVPKVAGDYSVLPGPEVSNSSSPLQSKQVTSDSSSLAALEAQVKQDELRQEAMVAPASVNARASLEQTAAAAKYGVRTNSASDGADVRWYFCKTPLRPHEAAAQVPASEVVGKGDYFRFSVRDSLALEAAFIQREEELVSAWWREYAEVSEGPVNSSSQNREQREGSIGDLNPLNQTNDQGGLYGGNSLDFDEGESVGVLVKGGLYEVDLMQRRCIPVYWRGEHRRVLRGHWYVRKGGLDWLPLREDVAEQLEIAYHKKVWRRRTFQPSGLYAHRVNLTGTSLGLHALFMGEDDSWEATLAVDASGISAVLGLKGSGVKLRRGFAPPDSATQDERRQRKEEELDDYASQVPVRHVVFMVHGIGQRLEKANLVDDVGTFRQTVSALAEQHLTTHQRNAQRILFIPCQWRRELKLGGEVAMENITLEGVRALRAMITATVHDVLYYMSPVYCQDIIDSVTRSLNRLYTKFIKRNPSFDGKVSLYGHSLGSVLTYDILCHQDTLTSAFPVQNVNASMMRNDDTEDDMPKIDRLPAINDNGSSSEDDLSVHNFDMAGPEISLDSEHATGIVSPEKGEGIVEEKILEDIEITMPKSDDVEHTETAIGTDIPEEIKCADENTELLQEVDESGKEVVNEVSIGEEDTVVVNEMTKIEGDKEAEKEVEVSEADAQALEKDEEKVKTGIENETEKEISQELESADNEKAIPEVTKRSEQDVLENIVITEMEKAEVSSGNTGAEGNAAGNEEISEVEKLKAKVALLEEKLRLLESRSMQNFSEEVGRPLDTYQATDESPSQDQSTAEEIKASDTIEDDSRPNLGPSASYKNLQQDLEFSSVRGNLEASVSSRKQHKSFITYPKLKFKVDTFYAVGSPLGMFLALRNIRIGSGSGKEYWQDEGIDEEMPACRLLLNIFHPYDPVAYRLEPLVCKDYVSKRPVFIPYHKGGKRLHIGLQEFSEDLSMKSKAIVDSIGSVGTRISHAFVSKKDDEITDEEEKERNREKPKSYGQLVMERLTGSSDGRIDCMLQDSTFEHQYISAISSHTSYWQDQDTALFILKHLYRNIPEEPETERVTMEPLNMTIDEDIETPKVAVPRSPVRTVSGEDDSDDGDEDSTSSFFIQESYYKYNRKPV